jgi:hypothetical protein
MKLSKKTVTRVVSQMEQPGERSGGQRMIVSQANGSNYTIKNEVEIINNDEHLTININKGISVPEIDQF